MLVQGRAPELLGQRVRAETRALAEGLSAGLGWRVEPKEPEAFELTVRLVPPPPTTKRVFFVRHGQSEW